MKINKKRLLILAVQLIALGLVIFGIGFATSKPDQDGYFIDEQVYRLSEVKQIQVETDSPKVMIKSVGGDSITFSWKTGEHVQYTEKLENGKLSVIYHLNVGWLDSLLNGGLNGEQFTLEIALPESYSGELDVRTVSGSIMLEEAESLDELELSSVSGTIDANDISVKNDIGIHATSGSVTVSDLYAGEDLDVKTVSGSMHLRKAEAQGVCDLSTGSGSLEVSALTTGDDLQMKTISGTLDAAQIQCGADLNASTTSALIRLKDIRCDSLSARSVSGEIDFHNLTASDIVLKTTSGAVKGTIQGAKDDYSISVHTVSGDNNLKNDTNGQGKNLKVDTVSGRIDIDFAD